MKTVPCFSEARPGGGHHKTVIVRGVMRDHTARLTAVFDTFIHFENSV